MPETNALLVSALTKISLLFLNFIPVIVVEAKPLSGKLFPQYKLASQIRF